jgi:hypothetical protein
MRFLSSASFLCAIGAFFLPWIDVRCESSKDESYGIVTQSGYQIATGESSEGDAKDKMEEKMKGLGIPVKKDDLKEKVGEKEKFKEVPVLWGFVGCVGVGAILCLLLPAGAAWRAGALVAALGAVGVLGYQVSEGFPAAQKIKADAESKAQQKGKPNIAMPLNIAEPKVVVVYKPGFYLAWFLAGLPAVLALIDIVIAPKPRPRHPDDIHDSANPFPDKP